MRACAEAHVHSAAGGELLGYASGLEMILIEGQRRLASSSSSSSASTAVWRGIVIEWLRGSSAPLASQLPPVALVRAAEMEPAKSAGLAAKPRA